MPSAVVATSTLRSPLVNRSSSSFLGGVGLARGDDPGVVGVSVDAVPGQPLGNALGIVLGQGVVNPLAGEGWDHLASQASRSTALIVGIACNARFSRISGPRETRTCPNCALTSATTGVRGRGGGEQRAFGGS